jgi:hypothetical protein
MKGHPVFRIAWTTANSLLLASVIFFAYSAGWEYSTDQYLDGFSDAIVPKRAAPEERVQAILNWMKSGPARRNGPATGMLSDRDPKETLNYRSLLQVCGSATNAFINLALRSGLRARRLLLVSPHGAARHVDAEVWIESRWIVVDPTFRIIMRGADGAFLTKQQLADPQTLAVATRGLAAYLPSYAFQDTSHVHVGRIKWIGPAIGKTLDAVVPGWEGSMFVTLFLERDSFAAFICAGFLSFLLVLARFLLSWYASARLGIHRIHFTERLRKGGLAFLKQMG